MPAEHADLVLSGGGVKGIGLVGAVAALVDSGYAPQRISGTSAGALVGAVLAAAAQRGAVDGARLQELAMSIDYRKFLDQGPIERIPLAGPAWGVLTGSGIYRGDNLHAWITDRLAEYGVSTFADLAIDDRALPPEQRYRLVVTVADVSIGQLVRLPWDYQRLYGLDPDEQLVADAVRASTAIPFFYRPATLTAADGREATLVDGGLLSNFPIDSLDRTDGGKPRWPTFGVTLLPEMAGELARERAAEKSRDAGLAHRTQVIAAGADAIERARRARLRACDARSWSSACSAWSRPASCRARPRRSGSRRTSR